MQEKHYKLILIVALLACVLPAFMGFDLYKKIKQANIAIDMPGAAAVNCEPVLDTHLADMFAYSILNIVAYVVLLLMIVYIANRALFAEKELEIQKKKLQDIGVK